MGRFVDIGDVLEVGGPHTNDNPHKTVPIPHCLRDDGGTLCQCDRTGWLVADDVCPRWCMVGHNQKSSLPTATTAIASKGLGAASRLIVAWLIFGYKRGLLFS